CISALELRGLLTNKNVLGMLRPSYGCYYEQSEDYSSYHRFVLSLRRMLRILSQVTHLVDVLHEAGRGKRGSHQSGSPNVSGPRSGTAVGEYFHQALQADRIGLWLEPSLIGSTRRPSGCRSRCALGQVEGPRGGGVGTRAETRRDDSRHFASRISAAFARDLRSTDCALRSR